MASHLVVLEVEAQPMAAAVAAGARAMKLSMLLAHEGPLTPGGVPFRTAVPIIQDIVSMGSPLSRRSKAERPIQVHGAMSFRWM